MGTIFFFFIRTSVFVGSRTLPTKKRGEKGHLAERPGKGKPPIFLLEAYKPYALVPGPPEKMTFIHIVFLLGGEELFWARLLQSIPQPHLLFGQTQ